MAEPSAADMHVDAALSDFSRAYFADPNAYVWPKAAPLIASPKQSNKFFVYDKAELLYVAAQKTAADQFVSLYKSLGGGWEQYQETPSIPQPRPAIVAAFERLLSKNSRP